MHELNAMSHLHVEVMNCPSVGGTRHLNESKTRCQTQKREVVLPHGGPKQASWPLVTMPRGLEAFAAAAAAGVGSYGYKVGIKNL